MPGAERRGCSSSRKLGPTPDRLPAPACRKRPRLSAGSVLCALNYPRPTCPAVSTRSRTRRAASARRRRRSTSPPASPRRASGRSSSTSTRRPTRPRGSASARTAARPTTCSTAPPLDELVHGDALREPRPRAGAAGPRRRRRRARRGERRRDATSPARSRGALRALLVRLPRLPAVARPADRQRARGRRPGARPGPVRVLRARGAHAAPRSIELIRARLNPRLSLAGMLLTMVDGRTRLAADVAGEVRRHFGDLVFEAVVPRSVRLAEAPSHGLPITAYDRASRGRRRLLPGGEGARRAALIEPPANRRRGLGRGLELLLGGRPPQAELDRAPVGVDPSRTAASRGGASTPRRSPGSPSRSARRASSSRSSSGPTGEGGYELIAGERRWRAARAAGLATMPALVREADDRDSLLLALVENVAREDLSAGRGGARLRRRSSTSSASRSAMSPSASAARSRRSRTGCACSSCRTTCSRWSSAAS